MPVKFVFDEHIKCGILKEYHSTQNAIRKMSIEVTELPEKQNGTKTVVGLNCPIR